jgi:hypothetical protein
MIEMGDPYYKTRRNRFKRIHSNDWFSVVILIDVFQDAVQDLQQTEVERGGFVANAK